jgi:putative MATE family efflux protein
MIKIKDGRTDMTAGSPLKLIIMFALPLLLGNIAQQTYNIADTIIVGNFADNSDECIAAIGVAMPIMFLMVAVFFGISQGATIIIAQFYGAGDTKSIKRAVDTIYIFLFVMSIPLTITGLIISRPILTLINAEGLILEYGVTYLSVTFFGILPSFGFNLNSGILQGLGNSKISLLFLAISNIVNIALDLLFIIVFGWGVAGVAFATVLAQSAAFLFGIYYINRKNFGFKISFDPKNLEFDFGLLKDIAKIGLPGGVQNAMFSVGFMFLHNLVNTINSYNPGFTAGFTGAQRIDAFAFLPIMSFSVAVTTFVGQNIGAGKLDRVKTGVRAACLLGICISVAVCLICLPLAGNLIGLFSRTDRVIKYGQAYLYRMMPFIWILAVHFILSNALRGAGQAMIPLLGSFIGLWLTRVPAAYIIYYINPGSPENIYFSFVIGWTIGLIPVMGYYLSGRWKKKAFRFLRSKESDE